ncbi:hypothetical protein K458DRAFT_409736 [Lentithecium fluviatile CBS 122367]|uniref:Uncharacterized protein n=1 Tax=Lentithecium fluviatile CBS 122367 TaxID=1168545 RepID=A0A6G1IGI2_9PLEO|nr:hypothetical protein K458DRAFT_409736 [Lentithecium fluviatile CBS 122367]
MASPSGRMLQEKDDRERSSDRSGSQIPPSPSENGQVAGHNDSENHMFYATSDPAHQPHSRYFVADTAVEGTPSHLASHLAPQPAQQGLSPLTGFSRDRRQTLSPHSARDLLRRSRGTGQDLATPLSPHQAAYAHPSPVPIVPTALRIGTAPVSQQLQEDEDQEYSTFNEDLDAAGSPDDQEYGDGRVDADDKELKGENQTPHKYYGPATTSSIQYQQFAQQLGPAVPGQHLPAELNASLQHQPLEQLPAQSLAGSEPPRTVSHTSQNRSRFNDSPGGYTASPSQQQGARHRIPPPTRAVDRSQVWIPSTPISEPDSAQTPSGKGRKGKEERNHRLPLRERHRDTGLFYNSHEEASSATKGPEWKMPENDPTIPQTDSEKQDWVRRLYDAFQSREEFKDKGSGPVVKARWLKKDDRGQYLDYYGADTVERVCWEIVEIVCKLHRVGPGWILVFDHETWRKGEKENHLNFHERMKALIELMKVFKNRCDKMMKGENTFATILAPLEAKKTAMNNREANDHRQECLRAGRKLKNEGTKPATQTKEDETGLSEAQSHTKRKKRKYTKRGSAGSEEATPHQDAAPQPRQADYTVRLQQSLQSLPNDLRLGQMQPSQRGGPVSTNAGRHGGVHGRQYGGHMNPNSAPFCFQQDLGNQPHGGQISTRYFDGTPTSTYVEQHGSNNVGSTYPQQFNQFGHGELQQQYSSANPTTPYTIAPPSQEPFGTLSQRNISAQNMNVLMMRLNQRQMGTEGTGFGGSQAFHGRVDQNQANAMPGYFMPSPTPGETATARASRGRKRGHHGQSPSDSEKAKDAHKRHRTGY